MEILFVSNVLCKSNDRTLAISVWMWDIILFDIKKRLKLIIKFGRPYPCLSFEFPCYYCDKQKAIAIGSPHLIKATEIGSPHFALWRWLKRPKWGCPIQVHCLVNVIEVIEMGSPHLAEVTEICSPHPIMSLCKGDWGNRNGVAPFNCITLPLWDTIKFSN